MSATITAPVSPPAKKGFGIVKAVMGGFAGLAAGVVGVYATALVDQVAKPAKPVANFAVVADGLHLTCQNQATGQTGWWDFGDGSPLEPFDPDKGVEHTYAKTGNYSVKLTVRNFLMEENDRTVPVDLSHPAAGQGDPTITNFTVEAIGGMTTAPATFRVRGEVKNAERVIWDLGGDKLEVTDSPGVFEKLVVLEKPGTFPIQMIGLTGKTPVKKTTNVTVAAPASGAMSVVLKVTDSGSLIERKEFPQTLSFLIPAKDPKPLERVLNARPGYTIAEAKIGAVKSPALKNLKVEIAADKKTAKLTGDWASTGEAAQKANGGSDVMVPVVLVVEKTNPVTLPTDTFAAAFVGETGVVTASAGKPTRSAALPIPVQPVGLTNPTRKMQLEVSEMVGDRVAKIGVVNDLKLPLRATVISMNADRQQYLIEATQDKTGALRIVLTPVTPGR